MSETPAPSPTDAPGISRRHDLSRRDLLTTAVGAVGVAVLEGTGVARAAAVVDGRPSPVLPPGRAYSARAAEPGTDACSAVAPAHTTAEGFARTTPHQDLMGMITPTDLHFVHHRATVPHIDPDRYRLVIEGVVEHPLTLTLPELKRHPRVSRIHFLECSANRRRSAHEEMTPEALAGRTGQSEWTGVPLAHLLRLAGVSPAATSLAVEAWDPGSEPRCIAIDKAWDDALIAYAQNGAPLRPERGFPVRLFLPGWAGHMSVKWLRRIQVGDAPAAARRGGVRARPDAGPFVLDVRSLITSPAFPTILTPGRLEIEGIAWSGRGKVVRVDVSTDGGRTWTPARLQEPVLPKAHTRFRHAWDWQGGETVVLSRAVDEAGGAEADAHGSAARPGAARPGTEPTVGWRIHRDGRVVLRSER